MGALQIQKFDFHGDELDVVQEGGRLWVSIRAVSDALGVDPDSQRRKLQGKPWATTVMMTVVAGDGKLRSVACIDLDALPMWLATIDLSRAASDLRPKLERYQVEAARVLRDHFFGGGAMKSEPQPDRLGTLQWAYGELKGLGVLSPESLGALVVRIAGEQGVDLSPFAPQLPASHARTWTATDIAAETGRTVAAVGRAISAAGVRAHSDFCLTVLTHAPGRDKQVPQYRYNPAGRALILEALGVEVE